MKEKIFDSEKLISEIAFELDFKYPQQFTRMFKKQDIHQMNID